MTNIFIGWIIILVPVLLGLFEIRRAIKSKSTVQRIVGSILFVILASASLFILRVFDSLSAANEFARLEVCKHNLEKMAVAIGQYRQDNRCFPSKLMMFYGDRRIAICPGGRNDKDAEYTYKVPESKNGKTIICWDSRPHYIEHKYLKFRDRRLRNMLRLDGTVETVSGNEYNELSSGNLGSKTTHSNKDLYEELKGKLPRSDSSRLKSLPELTREAHAIFVGEMPGFMTSGAIWCMFLVKEVLKGEEYLLSANAFTNSDSNDIMVMVSLPTSFVPLMSEPERKWFEKKFIVFLEAYPGKNKAWHIIGRDPLVGFKESTPEKLSQIISVLVNESRMNRKNE